MLKLLRVVRDMICGLCLHCYQAICVAFVLEVNRSASELGHFPSPRLGDCAFFVCAMNESFVWKLSHTLTPFRWT